MEEQNIRDDEIKAVSFVIVPSIGVKNTLIFRQQKDYQKRTCRSTRIFSHSVRLIRMEMV
jgi:hypothetical protein